jgi:predicted nuclease of predicted toxin-antitoxin system
MLHILADENFRDVIVRGILRRSPDCDIIRARDLGLLGELDPEVLARAADEGRILLTHDASTIPDFAYDRLGLGLPMPGVFILGNRFPTGPAIEHILFIDACSDQEEWDGRVVHLPLW